jgi:hypothetical protein
VSKRKSLGLCDRSRRRNGDDDAGRSD